MFKDSFPSCFLTRSCSATARAHPRTRPKGPDGYLECQLFGPIALIPPLCATVGLVVIEQVGENLRRLTIDGHAKTRGRKGWRGLRYDGGETIN